MKKGLIITSIGFAFLFIMVIVGATTNNNAFLIIWSVFCSGFFISVMVFLIKYIIDKRQEKRSYEAYKKTFRKATPEEQARYSNNAKRTNNNYSNNQNKTKTEKHSDYYGWEETGADAEYELIRTFDERIKKDFPDLPLKSFVLPTRLFQKLQYDISSNNIPSALTLQEIALHMEKHIGFSNDKAVVEVIKTDKPSGYTGTHERFLSTLSKIKIYYSPVFSAYNVLSILAHEIAHAYQQYYKHPHYSNDEVMSEKFTDDIAIYLGFTDIYKEGQRYKNGRMGYLSDNSLRYIDDLVKTRYTAEAPLRENKKKWEKIIKQANETLGILKMNFEAFKNDCSDKELWNKLTIASQEALSKKYLNDDYIKFWTDRVKKITQLTEPDANALNNELSHEVMALMTSYKELQKIKG
ncbi:MAG: superinfection exclusion B family protein [Bacilli bacterium]|nr:superinfection exclusion B family protein [Bacilli bacterium]